MSRPHTPRLSGLVASFIAALSVLAAAHGTQDSFAHDQVVETTPAPGEVVSSDPVQVRIVTSGELLDLGGNSAGFAITVSDESQRFFGDGCVDIDGPALSTTVALGDSGIYTVSYQYVSGDGHTLSGQYTFDYARPDDQLPAPPQSVAPVCGEDPVYPEELTSSDQPVSTDQQVTPTTTEEPDSPSAPPIEPVPTGSWIPAVVLALFVTVGLATLGYLWLVRHRAGSPHTTPKTD